MFPNIHAFGFFMAKLEYIPVVCAVKWDHVTELGQCDVSRPGPPLPHLLSLSSAIPSELLEGESARLGVWHVASSGFI